VKRKKIKENFWIQKWSG